MGKGKLEYEPGASAPQDGRVNHPFQSTARSREVVISRALEPNLRWGAAEVLAKSTIEIGQIAKTAINPR